MKTKITFIEWTAMLANFPPGTNRLVGRFYKLDAESKVRQCFDLTLEGMPNRESGRPSSTTPITLSVADRKRITNRTWYEKDKQAKRILLNKVRPQDA